MKSLLTYRFILISIAISLSNSCGTPTNTIDSSATEVVTAPTELTIDSVAFGSKDYLGNSFGWYRHFSRQLIDGSEFIRISPDAPLALELNSDASLDNIKTPTFWGYAIRHIDTQKVLPVYGELTATARKPDTREWFPVRYQGYFKLHQFQAYDHREVPSIKDSLKNISLVGFAGLRTFEGETHHVVSNYVANANKCEWKYNFWNSNQRFWGAEPNDFISFHARTGQLHKEGDAQWLVYTQLPKPVILDIEKPSIKILERLLASIAELPQVTYWQTTRYASDHVDCHRAHAYGGLNVGNSQHRYSIFYPRLKYFGQFAQTTKNFRFNRSPGLYSAANQTFNNKAGHLSKFLLMSRYEPWLAKSETSLPVASFTEFGPDMLYAVGPDHQLELWQVDPQTSNEETKTRLFQAFGHKVKNQFPITWPELDMLVKQRYLEKCDQTQFLMIGACDGSRFPSVILSNKGEQVEVWYSADNRQLFSWNPANKKIEKTQLAALSEGAEAMQASRAEFICQQLEENLTKIDRRLQRPFLSERPYAVWYEQDVPRLMGYVQRAVYAPRYDDPLDVANNLNNRERAGAKELQTLLKQARRAERLASDTYCPETKALAAEYVPLVEGLLKEVVTVLNDIWQDVRRQADNISSQIFRAKRAKDARQAEAWRKQFWANSMQQFNATMDISKTVNDITAQTNAMYQNALKIQQQKRKNIRQPTKPVSSPQAAPAPVVKSAPKPKAPQTKKKPAYEGFPQQQSFTINVPNAVSVKDLESATKIGGTTPVTIGGGTTGQNTTTQTSKPEPVKKGKKLLEGLSYCKPAKVKDKWFCEGRTQRLWTAETLEKGLSSSGCLKIRKWVPLNEGRLYFCTDYKIDPNTNTGKLTWNRDIADWVDIPASILADRKTFFE